MKTFIKILTEKNEYYINIDEIESVQAVKNEQGEVIYSINFNDKFRNLEISKGQYLQLLANSKVI